MPRDIRPREKPRRARTTRNKYPLAAIEGQPRPNSRKKVICPETHYSREPLRPLAACERTAPRRSVGGRRTQRANELTPPRLTLTLTTNDVPPGGLGYDAVNPPRIIAISRIIIASGGSIESGRNLLQRGRPLASVRPKNKRGERPVAACDDSNQLVS